MGAPDYLPAGNLTFAKMQRVELYFIVVSINSALNTGEGDHFPIHVGHLGFLFCDCLSRFFANFSV